jgi:zinc transport system permease protein
VSLAIKIVGALLIGALMVIPVITSIQFKRGFGQTILAAIFISLFSVVSGLFISYHLGWASGGTIVIIALIIFLFSLILTRERIKPAKILAAGSEGAATHKSFQDYAG